MSKKEENNPTRKNVLVITKHSTRGNYKYVVVDSEHPDVNKGDELCFSKALGSPTIGRVAIISTENGQRFKVEDQFPNITTPVEYKDSTVEWQMNARIELERKAKERAGKKNVPWGFDEALKNIKRGTRHLSYRDRLEIARYIEREILK